jgi:hypothetical protein
LWSLTIMTETLFAVILVVGLWLWLLARGRSNLVLYFCVGVLLGGGALVRNIGLLVIPAWVVFALIQQLKPRNIPQGIKQSLAIALGAGLIVLAWSAHNLGWHGKFMFTDQSSRTFYSFNIARVLGQVEGISRGEAATIINESPDPAALTLDLVREHPFTFIGVQLKGVARSMFGVSTGVWARAFGYPLELQGSFNVLGNFLSGNIASASGQIRNLFQRPESIILLILSILALAHAFSQYLFGAGILLGRSGNAIDILLILVTVAILIGSPGAVGQARFGIPAAPYTAVLAGVGLQGFYVWLSDRRRSSGSDNHRPS